MGKIKNRAYLVISIGSILISVVLIVLYVLNLGDKYLNSAVILFLLGLLSLYVAFSKTLDQMKIVRKSSEADEVTNMRSDQAYFSYFLVMFCAGSSVAYLLLDVDELIISAGTMLFVLVSFLAQVVYTGRNPGEVR